MSRIALVLIALARLHAADAEPRWMQANRAAREALLAKDWAKLRAAIAEFAPMAPGNPRVAYNLAVAEAKLGNRDAALKALRDWAEMGLVADVAGDDNLATLRDAPEFAAVIARVAKSKEAVGRSTVAFPLPVRDMIPEDIAYDPATRRFFVSSVRKGIVITADVLEFARSQCPILALRVDGAHKLLWASTGYVPHGESVKEADKDQTALLAFDLATGEQKRRIESPLPGLLGDMTIARSG